MLNYISAEWYKLRRTKGIFVAFGVLLVLIGLLFFPAAVAPEPTFPVYTGTYILGLLLGFFLAPIFAVRAFDDQYGRGTMKNEVVFGIPRQRTYLGKLAFGGMAGTLAAFLVLGVYLLLCLLTGGWQDEYALLCIDLCVQSTLLVLPLWLASLSLAFFLQAVFKSSAVAVTLDYLILLVAMPIALVGGEEPTASPVLNFMNHWFFAAPYRSLYSIIDVELGLGNFSSMAYSWLVGLGWIAATTLLGLAVFSRKEIN